jgi:Zn-finger nucleic acid-binding protein
VNCPNCGAPMRLEVDKDYLICDYCGNVHVGEANADGVRVLGEAATEQCPICAIPLMHAAIDNHRILYCERCRGMLIAMDIFVSLVGDLRSRREATAPIVHPVDQEQLDQIIRCPKCGQDMDTHVYGGGGNVVMNDCERCELNWLDHGELERIVRAPDHQYAVDLR